MTNFSSNSRIFLIFFKRLQKLIISFLLVFVYNELNCQQIVHFDKWLVFDQVQRFFTVKHVDQSADEEPPFAFLSEFFSSVTFLPKFRRWMYVFSFKSTNERKQFEIPSTKIRGGLISLQVSTFKFYFQNWENKQNKTKGARSPLLTIVTSERAITQPYKINKYISWQVFTQCHCTMWLATFSWEF